MPLERTAFRPDLEGLQNKAARRLNVSFVDMNDQICMTRLCSLVRNGIVVFTDDNHLTASFTRSLVPTLGESACKRRSESSRDLAAVPLN